MIMDKPQYPMLWWSEPITVGVPSPTEAIRLGLIASRGWNRKVRLSLIQNGQTLPPVTFMMPQPTLQVLLSDLGPFGIHSAFSACVSLEFEFSEGPDDTVGRPWVEVHAKMPIFEVLPSIPPLSPSLKPVVQDLRHRFLVSRGNGLQIMVHDSRVHSDRR
ncbi:hypothetical protein IFR05_002658 [Cadophora sp. M221]|nr:hypothetical protein IFR05_002658 [Cadophora sp. M221]